MRTHPGSWVGRPAGGRVRGGVATGSVVSCVVIMMVVMAIKVKRHMQVNAELYNLQRTKHDTHQPKPPLNRKTLKRKNLHHHARKGPCCLGTSGCTHSSRFSGVCCSTAPLVRRSTLLVRRSTLLVRRSTLLVRRSTHFGPPFHFAGPPFHHSGPPFHPLGLMFRRPGLGCSAHLGGRRARRVAVRSVMSVLGGPLHKARRRRRAQDTRERRKNQDTDDAAT